MARIRVRPHRGGGEICALPSLRRGSSGHRRWWTKPSAAAAAPPSRGATSIGRRSPRTIRSSPPALPHGCSATRTGGSGSSASAMALDTAAVDRALGAIGTTFRLRRLYPPSHPAVMEAVHHLAEALPPLASLGTISSEDTALGPIALARARRGAHRFEPARTGQQAAVVPAASETSPAPAPPPPASPASAGPLHPSGVFRLDALPPDVEAKRAIAALGNAASPEEQCGAVEKLTALAPHLLAGRDVATVAGAIVALDRLLATAHDPGLLAAIDRAGAALSDRAVVARMVQLLGEPRGAPGEREVLVAAVGALATLSVQLVLDAFIATAVDERAPYRAAIRKAADRALEPLQARLADKDPHVVAAAAELMGLTGSPQAVPLLAGLLRHPSDFVREAALLGLAEGGGREVSRPAMPALKDESIAVRIAAVRAIMAGGDSASTTVLIRRLEQESDEGVQAEMLRAIGRLGGADALDVLAHYAEPGGRLSRRSATVRAAANDGLRHLAHPDARGLLELYSHDKEPLVRKAAETALK